MESDNLNILVDEELFNDDDIKNTVCPLCKNELKKNQMLISKYFKRSKCECLYCIGCYKKLKIMESQKKKMSLKKLIQNVHDVKWLYVNIP